MPDGENMIVGLDFDNTIINYNESIYWYAVNHGFCDVSVSRDKKTIRDRIRQLEDGEMKWRKLQAYVYGPGIMDGVLNRGVLEFVRACGEHKVKVYIISHKTKFAASDETGTRLRESALSWIRDTGFFDQTGLCRKDVFFEDTREDKINRLITLGCTHFIDDLEETFREPSFPQNVVKILYAPNAGITPRNDGVIPVSHFHDIQSEILCDLL